MELNKKKRQIIVCFILAVLMMVVSALQANAVEIVLVKIVINKGKKQEAHAFVEALRIDLEKSVSTGASYNQLETMTKRRIAKFNTEHGVKLPTQGKTNADIDILMPGKKISREDKAFLHNLELQLAQKIDRGELQEKNLPVEVEKAIAKYAARQGGETASWGNEKSDTVIILALEMRF